MRLVLGHDAEIADWVARQIPRMTQAVVEAPFGKAFGDATAIGVVGKDGWLRGGVVYHNYLPQHGNIELSCAAIHHRWLTRKVISGLLGYPFGQLGCGRVTSITPKRNHDARRFLEELGFKREGVIRAGLGDDDAILYGMLKGEWARSRWNVRRAEAPHEGAKLQRASIVRPDLGKIGPQKPAAA